jgi:hypothetical protein
MLAKQVQYLFSHSSSSFFSGYFGDGVLKTIVMGWPQITILLILASQVASDHVCVSKLLVRLKEI